MRPTQSGRSLRASDRVTEPSGTESPLRSGSFRRPSGKDGNDVATRLRSVTLALGCASCTSPTKVFEAGSRSNITVMLAGDQGWQDISEPFAAEGIPIHERYRTPNLERLAEKGMQFTNSHSNPV